MSVLLHVSASNQVALNVLPGGILCPSKYLESESLQLPESWHCLKPWSSVWLFLLYQEMLSSKGGQHFSQCFRKSLLTWGDFPLRRDLANTQNRPWGEREGGLWLETGGGSRASRSPAHPLVPMAAASSAWPCPGAGRADTQPTCISRAMCEWVTLSKSLECCMALLTKFGSVNPQDRPKYESYCPNTWFRRFYLSSGKIICFLIKKGWNSPLYGKKYLKIKQTKPQMYHFLSY